MDSEAEAEVTEVEVKLPEWVEEGRRVGVLITAAGIASLARAVIATVHRITATQVVVRLPTRNDRDKAKIVRFRRAGLTEIRPSSGNSWTYVFHELLPATHPRITEVRIRQAVHTCHQDIAHITPGDSTPEDYAAQVRHLLAAMEEVVGKLRQQSGLAAVTKEKHAEEMAP